MSSKSSLSRRNFLRAAVGLGGALTTGALFPAVKRWQQPRAAVTILKAADYTLDLYDLVRRGLKNYPNFLQRIKDRQVLLKPNLVEYYQSRSVNTHPALVAAAIAAFRHFGAREVVVGEGPGHRRDMEILLELSGLDTVLHDEAVRFVDLNLDVLAPITLNTHYTKLTQMFFPTTVLQADVLVSMPKMKSHHWTGATLSLKNMFGVVPGAKYGWPKNLLHWKGIHNSIVDINTTIRPDFAIVDGIEGMEGDGPLYGDTVHSGVIVMGDNLTAVDATGARVMGLYPERIQYLIQMLAHGGVVNAGRIRQLGEPIAAVALDFKVLPHFQALKKPLSAFQSALLVGW